MPRTEEQFERMRRDSKEKIQSAALKLFAYKGLTATSVQEIADMAGVSVGLLYRYYKTKEALFYELVDFAIDGLKEIAVRLKGNGSPKAIIQSIIDEIYEDLKDNDDFVNLQVLLTQAVLSSREDSKLNNLLEQDFTMLQSMADLIQRGQEKGEFISGDPKEMSMFFFSVIQGITISKAIFQPMFILPDKSRFSIGLFKEGNN